MTLRQAQGPEKAAQGPARYVPAIVGAALVVFMEVLPLLNLSLPGILPTPTYMPGTLALLSLCMVFAALALSYNLLLGSGGMLSFGHALYFGAGAYGLGIALEHFGVPLWPGVFIALIGGMLIALVTGAVSMRVSGIPFAMVTLAFAQAGSVLVRRNSQVTGGEEGLSLNTDQVPDSGAFTNCTSRPKAMTISCPMTMPSPQVARIASSGRLYSGLTMSHSTAMPTTTPATKASGQPSQGSSLSWVTT